MLRLRKKAVDTGLVASRRWLQSSCAMKSSFGMVRRNDARLAAAVQVDVSMSDFLSTIRDYGSNYGSNLNAFEKLTETGGVCIFGVRAISPGNGISGNLIAMLVGCVHFLAPCMCAPFLQNRANFNIFGQVSACFCCCCFASFSLFVFRSLKRWMSFL